MPLPVTGSAANSEVQDASPSPPGTPGRAGPPVGSRVVDLSLLLAEELPCTWSTHMPFQQKTFTYFADEPGATHPLQHRGGGPYQTRWLIIDEHTGTHVDAPAHFIPEAGTGLPHAAEIGSVTADQIPLEQLMGPAVVVDVGELVPAEPGESPIIGPEAVERFESVHGRIRPGEVVLLRSGWDARYRVGAAGSAYCHDAVVTRTGPGWPAPEPPLMQLLVDRGVRCVGTDGVSMGSAHDGAPVHLLGLGHGVAFVEGLAGLDALPPRGAYFCFSPLRLARGTGAPGRAFAWLPDTVR